MSDHTYRMFDEERDQDAAVRVLSLAFGGSTEDSTRWLEDVGHVTRVHEADGTVLGALSLYPMGHWFGGRSVPAWGVAGVAVDPVQEAF